MKSFHVSKITALFLSLFAISLVWSSPSEILEVPTEIDVRIMFTVDINYDGVDDLVVGGEDGVMILIADGKRGFKPPDPLLGGKGLIGVADTNEDGFLDIITTTSVILGNINGRWSMGPNHNLIGVGGLDNEGGEVADFDKDGHIDFIVGTTSSAPYRVFYGDGTGNFTRDTTFGPKGEYLVAQDVDGNELPDIVQGSQDGEVYVYLNLGQRQWSEVTSYSIPLPPGYVDRIYRPALADFTGDGVIDIIAGGYGKSKIYLFEGNGDGTFKDARHIADFVHVGQLSIADFDKDGMPDVLASSYPIRGSKNLIMIIYGDQTGQFSRQIVIPLGSSHIDAATGDWNNDGWQDIAVLSWTTDTVSILFNDGTGSFTVPNLLFEDYFLESSADFDFDGYKDLVLVRKDSFWDMHLYIAYGNANGIFEEPQQISHKDMSTISSGFVLGYFDETPNTSYDAEDNRRLDIGYTTHDGTLYILLNKGNRTWSEHVRAMSSGRDIGGGMVTGDFDEDGFNDIVSVATKATAFISDVQFLTGRGDGTFIRYRLGPDKLSGMAIPTINDGSYSAFDLDYDGHLDIVIAEDPWQSENNHGGWIGWGKGDGSFDFVWNERIKGFMNGHRIWLADINGDGLYDIIEINPDQVMLNLGNRLFGGPLPFGGEPIDINGDGNLDILKTYTEEGCLSARFGDGNFGWSYPELWVHGDQLSGTNIVYGSPGDPMKNILIGKAGMWNYPNPWKNVIVTDTYGPQILDYIGPLNPGFTIAPTEFVLKLSEPIDPSTIHANSVYLVSAGGDGLLGSSDDKKLNGTLSYDDASRRINFIPEGSIFEGPHRFVVSGEGVSAIRDLAGNDLDGTVYEVFPSISGNGSPGGSFISTFYVVDSLPASQVLDTKEEDASGEPASPELVVFDSKHRATITGWGKGLSEDDYGDTYFLGNLIAGEVVTADLDGSGAGLTLGGGMLSILRHLPEGWVTFASACLTDEFIDSHLSFPIRYDGEYVLVVFAGHTSVTGANQMWGTYSVDIAIDSTLSHWEPISQTILLDFDGSQTNLWDYIEPFNAGQLDFDSEHTNELIDSITAIVQEDFAQFSNINIISEKPEGVDFSRISVGAAWVIEDPQVDNWNLNCSDEGLVNSYSFWGMRHYGLEAVAQAMANTISHQIGHLLGLQHRTGSVRSIMNDYTPVDYLVENQNFSKGRYWWSENSSIYRLLEQDTVHFLEYNTGPTLPAPVPPTVGSLTAEPNSVMLGETFRLYPQDVRDIDGRIVEVEFYYDKNANGVLEIGIDEYLIRRTYSPWRWPVQTSDYPQGEHIFLARAMDNDGAWSNVVSVTVTINEP